MMNLCHYAAEYGCTQFFRSLALIIGDMHLLLLFCKQSHNGMNGFHFLAQNCHYLTLNFVAKLVKKLPSESQMS